MITNFEPDFFVEDKHSLLEYGINAKIISLPGHTAGSIGILVNSKVLIAGDVLFNMIKPTVALIAEDPTTLYQRIDKIKQLDIDTIYVGHGKAISSKNLFSDAGQIIVGLSVK